MLKKYRGRDGVRQGEALGEELVLLGLGPSQENKNPFFSCNVTPTRWRDREKTHFTNKHGAGTASSDG